LYDRDAKFCPEFCETLAAGGVTCLRLPPRSPNWNAFAERWVRSVKQECLCHLILFGERSLRKALTQFQEHYHEERNHQGKNNVLLFPAPARLEPGENASAAYFGTTAAPHEYFDQTGWGKAITGSEDVMMLTHAGVPLLVRKSEPKVG
jgi:hypothetical protein